MTRQSCTRTVHKTVNTNPGDCSPPYNKTASRVTQHLILTYVAVFLEGLLGRLAVSLVTALVSKMSYYYATSQELETPVWREYV